MNNETLEMTTTDVNTLEYQKLIATQGNTDTAIQMIDEMIEEYEKLKRLEGTNGARPNMDMCILIINHLNTIKELLGGKL